MRDPMGLILAAARTNPTLMDAARQVEARLRAAEADADRLALHLRQLCDEMYAERYEPNRPCRGCYQAVYDHDELAAQR